LRSALIDKARQFPGQEQQVLEYYQNTPQALAELRVPLFEDKVVNYLFELVAITEKKVSTDEFHNPIQGLNLARYSPFSSQQLVI